MGLYDKPCDQWTDDDMRKANVAMVTYAIALPEAGFHISPSEIGRSMSLRKGWEEQASTDPQKVRDWAGPGVQFVMVAKKGFGSALDIDDPEAVAALGFDWSWVEGCLWVRSASGSGRHIYLPWHPCFNSLPWTGKLDICLKGKAVAEWKLHNTSVAAPWCMRSGMPGKPDGWYVPVPRHRKIGKCPAPEALRDWALANARGARPMADLPPLEWEWHKSFDPDDDMEELLALYGCEEKCRGRKKDDHTVLWVVPEECPLCDRESIDATHREDDATGARCKFVFGGRGIGLVALCCRDELPQGMKAMEALRRKLRLADPNWKDWDFNRRPIYKRPEWAEEEEAGSEEQKGKELLRVEEAVPRKAGVELEEVGKPAEAPESAMQEEPPLAPRERQGSLPHDQGPGWWWAEKKQELLEKRTSWREGDDDKKYREERHVVEEEVWSCVQRALQEKCDFLRDAYPYLFVRDEALLVDLHDDVEALSLLGRLGLLATQPHTKLVKENLELLVHTDGKDVEMGHWGKLESGKLYVNNGRGGMFRLPPEGRMEEVPNGTDGVYMHDPAVLAWPSLEEMGAGMARAVFQCRTGSLRIGPALELGLEPPSATPLCQYLNAPFEEQSLKPRQYLTLLMARWLSLFMRGASSLFPICFATGEQGSGKTTVFEKMVWLVEGWGEKAGAMPKDLRGLLAVLTNRHVAIFDNVDRTKWDEDNRLDYICAAATGGHVELAQLYQTNVARKYRLHCDQFLTARHNVWPEGATDAGRRTLFFPLRPPDADRIIERDKWRNDLERNRTLYLAETLVRLRGCLRCLQLTEGRSYPHRSEMHEFETLTMRLADAEGWADEMAAIWEGYMGDYKAAMVEHSPLVGAMMAWAGGPAGRKAIDEEGWVGSAEIYEEVRRLLDWKDMRWNGSKSFGRAMANGMTSLSYALGAKSKVLHGNRLYAFSPSLEAREKARQAFEACGGGARNAIEQGEAAKFPLD